MRLDELIWKLVLLPEEDLRLVLHRLLTVEDIRKLAGRWAYLVERYYPTDIAFTSEQNERIYWVTYIGEMVRCLRAQRRGHGRLLPKWRSV